MMKEDETKGKPKMHFIELLNTKYGRGLEKEALPIHGIIHEISKREAKTILVKL